MSEEFWASASRYEGETAGNSMAFRGEREAVCPGGCSKSPPDLHSVPGPKWPIATILGEARQLVDLVNCSSRELSLIGLSSLECLELKADLQRRVEAVSSLCEHVALLKDGVQLEGRRQGLMSESRRWRASAFSVLQVFWGKGQARTLLLRGRRAQSEREVLSLLGRGGRALRDLIEVHELPREADGRSLHLNQYQPEAIELVSEEEALRRGFHLLMEERKQLARERARLLNRRNRLLHELCAQMSETRRILRRARKGDASALHAVASAYLRQKRQKSSYSRP